MVRYSRSETRILRFRALARKLLLAFFSILLFSFPQQALSSEDKQQPEGCEERLSAPEDAEIREAISALVLRINDYVENGPKKVLSGIEQSEERSGWKLPFDKFSFLGLLYKFHPSDPIDLYVPLDRIRRDLSLFPLITQVMVFRELNPHDLEEQYRENHLPIVIGNAILKTFRLIVNGELPVPLQSFEQALDSFNASNSFGIRAVKVTDSSMPEYNWPHPWYGLRIFSRLDQKEKRAEALIGQLIPKELQYVYFTLYRDLRNHIPREIFLDHLLDPSVSSIGQRIANGLNAMPLRFTFPDDGEEMTEFYMPGGSQEHRANDYLKRLLVHLNQLGIGHFELGVDRKFAFTARDNR